MKLFYQNLLLVFLLSFSVISFGQNGITVLDKSDKNVPVLAFAKPDLTQIHLENQERDNKGFMYRFAFTSEVNVTTQNSGMWSTLPNGDKVWRLKVKYPGAQALSFYFSKFYLFGKSEINIYNADGEKLHATYTANDVQETGVQNMSLCLGDNMMIELVEPYGTTASVLEMESIAYAYRSISRSENKDFGHSEDCQVNVNCSEGNSWQDEKKGVARILVYAGGSQGWCSGSLVNNTAQDCKPYFLTAMHCADGTSTSNFAQWRFYFKYEANGCSSPTSQGTLANNYITGCLKIAGSNDVNGNTISKSDFLLVKLGTASNEATIINTLKNTMQAYWNGWDANNVTSNSGVSIHHPAGDIKKISSYSNNLSSTSYSGVNSNTHWQVTWVSTANGHGVTEGGSSGSPIFNGAGNSRIKGVLSGGSSYCETPNYPDLYGKISYSWTSAGTTNETRLKPWLDPTNSGVLVLDGSSDPCSSSPGTPITPVAQFVASQTNITPNTTVTFTDQSTNAPTSWSWSIAPATGFSYAGGTTSTSQNPQITFTTVGTYSVTLTASNTAGSDSEVKNAYIIVANATGPCAATSTLCDEYIGNVQLNTINNSTACNNYTDYANQSTTLVKGQSYSISIAPAVDGNLNSAYTNDQIAAYIDFNNDMDFDDAGERIAYSVFNANYTGTFNFTVPANAVTGTVRMRVRIHYPTSAMPNVLPCGTSTNGGEVEDYRINIVATGGVGVEEVSLNAITLFPNPASDEINVALNSNFQTANVVVMDLAGKEILKANYSNVEQIQLNVADLSSGMYHVVISTELGQIIRKINKK